MGIVASCGRRTKSQKVHVRQRCVTLPASSFSWTVFSFLPLSHRQELWRILAIAVLCNRVTVGVFMLHALCGRDRERTSVMDRFRFHLSLKVTNEICWNIKRQELREQLGVGSLGAERVKLR